MFNNIKKEQVVIAIAAIILITSGIYFWNQSQSMEKLFLDLENQESVKISQQLDELKIPYEVSKKGDILVKSSELSSTKFKLSSEKILSSESEGLEIFKDLDYGMTEFSQKVHYQRAIQGELVRSIKNIEGIKNARVLLSMPEKRLFKNNQKKASAAISIEGENITFAKLNSISELVAAAVDNLSPSDVVISDSKGSIFNLKGSDLNDLSGKLQQKITYEQNIKNKVANLLSRAINENDFHISVNVEFDYNIIKQTNNGYLDAEKSIVLKRSTTGSKKESKTENTEFGYGTRVESIEFSPGVVKKITAGIIITKPTPKQVIEQLTILVSSAIGIERNRGDVVSIIAIEASNQTISNDLEFVADTNIKNTSEKSLDTAMEIGKPEPDSTTQQQNKNTNANIFASPQFTNQNIMLAMTVTILMLLIWIFIRNPRNLSKAKKKQLTEQIQEWLKE